MTGGQVDKYAREVSALLEERLRIRGRSLEHQINRAGRLLPKAVQREARYIVQAARFMTHPKLRLMIDTAKVEKAHKTVVTHLRTIDPKERAKTRLLGILGVASFNVILVVAALIGYLIWGGYV